MEYLLHSSSNQSSSGVLVSEKLLLHWLFRTDSTVSEVAPELKIQFPFSSFSIQKSLTVDFPLDSTSSITVRSTCV